MSKFDEMDKAFEEYKKEEEKALNTCQNPDIKYISLKLDKKIDISVLELHLHSFMRFKVLKGTRNLDDYTWRDIVHLLLKADGSWDKDPRLYNKYTIEKEVKEKK